MQRPLKNLLIVGGGSAGWMTAALFAQLFRGLYRIELVESEEIGTIGVGEATIPAIKKFNELLKLDEADFMRMTQGTFKLGIQFNDWQRIGSSYIHGFGLIGKDWEWLRCHHYWLKLREMGEASDFANYSINTAAALQNKFMRCRPEMAESPLAHIAHAFHFDAGPLREVSARLCRDARRQAHRRQGRRCFARAGRRRHSLRHARERGGG